MTLTPSDVASIATWSTVWEICEYVSEAVVFVGCVGEFIAEYTYVGTDQWRHTLGRRSLIILILGIGAGLFSLIKTNALAGQVIGSLGEQSEQSAKKAQRATEVSNTAIAKSGQAAEAASDATLKASKAEGSASGALSLARGARREADSFEKDIKDAKRDSAEAKALLSAVRQLAAEAQKRATSAEGRVGGVESKVADRHVASAQADLIHKALGKWKDIDLPMVVINGDGESETFADEILNTLATVPGWSLELAEITTPSGMSGLVVEVSTQANNVEKMFAAELVAALRAAGVQATGPTTPPHRGAIFGGGRLVRTGKFNPQHTQNVGIEIGKKP